MALVTTHDFEDATGVGDPIPLEAGFDGVDSALYTDYAMHGSWAAELPQISPSPFLVMVSPNSGTNFAVSAYVYIAASGSGACSVLNFATGPGATIDSVAKVRCHPDGRFDISNGANLRQDILDGALWEVGEWHRIDVNVLHSGGTATFNVKVSKPAEVTAPAGEATYEVSGVAPLTHIHLGTGNSQWSLVADTVRIYDAQTAITPINPQAPPEETEYDENGEAHHDFEEGVHGEGVLFSEFNPVSTNGVVGASNPVPTYTATNPLSGARSVLIPATAPGPYLEYNVPNTDAFSVSVSCRVDTPGTSNAANFLVLEEVGGLELVRIRLHQAGVIDVADRNNLRVLNSNIPWSNEFRIDARYVFNGQEVALTGRVYDLTDGGTPLGEFSTTVSMSDFGDPPVPGVPARLRIGTSNGNWGITIDDVRRFQTPTWTGPEPAGIVYHHWVGANRHDRFMVRSKTGVSQMVGLRYSTNPSMSSPTSLPEVAPDQDGYVIFDVTGLDPSTTYYYQLFDSNGTVGDVGRARTLATPGTPSTIRVALGACTLKNHMDGSAHYAVAAWNPDFFIQTGDFYYTSSTSTNAKDFESLYEDIIETYPGYGELTRDVPMWHCASDHEAGPDNGDSNNAWTRAHIDAYMHIVPNRVADTRTPVRARYQSWVSGRVRFIMTDVRTLDRSPGLSADDGAKTMLGATQKAWLKEELLKPEPLKIIITDPGWMGSPTTAQGEDKWWSYATERQELINFINANQLQVEVWHGDSHSIAVKGKNNPYGGFPVLCSAPMAQTGGGRMLAQFDDYWNNDGNPARSWMRITITDDGETITRVAQGIDATTGEVKVSSTETYSGDGPVIETGVRVWEGTALVESTEVGVWDGEQFVPAENIYVWNGTRLANLNETA